MHLTAKVTEVNTAKGQVLRLLLLLYISTRVGMPGEGGGVSWLIF